MRRFYVAATTASLILLAVTSTDAFGRGGGGGGGGMRGGGGGGFRGGGGGGFRAGGGSFHGGGSSFRGGGASSFRSGGFSGGNNFRAGSSFNGGAARSFNNGAARSFSSGSFRSASPGFNNRGLSSSGFTGRQTTGFGQRSLNSTARLGYANGGLSGNRNFAGGNWNNNFRGGNNWYRGNYGAGWNNRPWGWGRGNYGWGRPYGWGFGTGLLTGLALGGWGYGGYGYGGYGYGGYGNWGYSGYSNPYYSGGGYPAYVDYSQPIGYGQDPSAQVASVDGGAAPQSGVDPVAQQQFEAARQAFADGQYDAALQNVDAALAKMPNDGALHELRGLILFATGKYPQAAATAYAVLSVGPGWDWATLSSLYSDPNVYTQQLRALERYRNQNMNAPEIHFLTGYHYLVTGYKSTAATEFAAAAKLNPKDELSRQIVASLTGKAVERPVAPATTTPPSPPTPPAAGDAGQGTPIPVNPPVDPGPTGAVTPVQPVDPQVAPAKPSAVLTAASVLGDWKASRDDGSSFQLKLTQDNRFAWTFTAKDGKVQYLSGTFTVADGFLILKQNENSALVGAVKPLAQGFNFKLVGDNPSDPGLNFGK